MFKKLVKTLIPLSLVLSLTACINDGPYSKGTDYKVLNFAQKSSQPQVVLYFSPTCPHCYMFDEVFEKWVEGYEGKASVERIPVRFTYDAWQRLQKTYATLRVMGVQDKMTLEMFKAIQDDRIFLGDARSTSVWMSQFGYDAEQVLSIYNSAEVENVAAAYRASEERYRVNSIPKLVINGKYEVIIKELEAETKEERLTNLTKVIDYLIALEE